jgi:hypothetical protein
LVAWIEDLRRTQSEIDRLLRAYDDQKADRTG